MINSQCCHLHLVSFDDHYEVEVQSGDADHHEEEDDGRWPGRGQGDGQDDGQDDARECVEANNRHPEHDEGGQ